MEGASGQDLISFLSPTPNKNGRSSFINPIEEFDTIGQPTNSINNNNSSSTTASRMDQLKAVQALFNTDNLSRPPQPFPRSIVPVLNQNGSFSYPHQPFMTTTTMPPPPSPFGPPRGSAADNVFLSPNFISPGSAAAGFANGQQPRFIVGGGGRGGPAAGRPGTFYEQEQGRPRRPIVLQPHTIPYHHQAVSYTPGGGFMALPPPAMVKSQSWSSDDLTSSTPKHPAASLPGFATPSRAAAMTPPPPPPSLRSSVSSFSLDQVNSRLGSVTSFRGSTRNSPRPDSDSLIDLETDTNTTVSVVEEFDPLTDQSQNEEEAEDIYWSSRESTSRFSNNLNDSYDPFSYMADRVEQLGQQQQVEEEDTDRVDSDLPQIPPKVKKVGVVRPLAEASEATLIRRKTVARNYENVVKKDAKFFQCIGVAKTPAVAQDGEVLAFTNMVREIRQLFIHSDTSTNPGLVKAARLEANYPAGTELKIVVHHRGCPEPVNFTASVNTELTQIVAKVLVELDRDIDCCSAYLLQVHGKGEYLQDGTLSQYEYVHQCYKYDRDVRLTMVHQNLVQRSLARTEEDDLQDLQLSYQQISPLDHARTLSHEDLKTLLEFLQKEAERISATARTLATCSEKCVLQSLNPRGMLQAVKAVCAKLGGVETLDLAEALDEFSQACVKYDCAKGNEDPSGRVRPEIVEEVGERYAMVTFHRTNTESFDKHVEDIEASLRKITEKIYSLIRTYSRTFRVDFALEQIDSISPGELKYSTSVNETLLIRVGCLHRVDPSWDYLDYKIDLRIFHGTKLMREPLSTTYQPPEQSHQRLHKTVSFAYWIDVKALPIAQIPLEARLVFSLVGRSRDPVNKDNLLYSELGWTGLQLYSHDRQLSQGSFLLAFWPVEANQQIGPAPDSGSHPRADTCPLLSLEMLDLGGPVEFPVLEPALSSPYSYPSLDQLDSNTREQLIHLCEQDILSFHSRPSLEKEVLWEKRHYLRRTPGALPKVLLSVRSWEPDCLVDLYGLLDTWPRPDIIDTLQLFLPIFPDSVVRAKAVSWLDQENSDQLADFLPQLLEAVKHETWSVCPLVRFLLSRCLSSPGLTHSLYWLLTQSLPGISPQNSESGRVSEVQSVSLARHKRRLLLLLRAVFVISGEALRNRFLAQQVLMQELDKAADSVKTAKDSSRATTLLRHMENLQHQLITTPTLVPLSASLTARGVEVKSCNYFNSNTFPLKIVLNSAEDDGGLIQIIYKVGDDLRQDMLTLQMIRVMDRLWLRAGLDLRIVCFSCVPTGWKAGMVEFVEDAKTFREIQVADQGVTGTFKPETLNDWLQKHNPSQLQFRRAVTNFIRSCAGYSVVTYVLGICDRHNDNIMLKTSGHLFHIDFGKFLGDAQKFGAIRRDRVPFVLTPDMVFVINGGKGSTEKFHTFVELCCKAFNVLRNQGNLILTLFALMASSGIPGVTKEAVNYVHERLLLDLSNEEAAARFAQLIHESINNSFSTQFNFFVHNLAQLKFGGGGAAADSETLSFIPNKYSMKSDGKMKGVEVHGIQKRYDTEKHYVFILKVTRQGIRDPSYIFRTYKQFCEFHSRLCTIYPLTKFHSLTKGYSIRSNIKDVAEKRKREIAMFLQGLFQLAEEIAHSDLVYTFFHPLLRDEEEYSIHIQKLKEPRSHQRKPSVGRINGRMKISLRYRHETLLVMIYHVENLAFLDASREEPNAYVKVYLHPDPSKQTKRKTKVVKKSCNPTFMEMLEYRIPIQYARCRTLEATVWDSSQFQENMFLGSVSIPLETVNLEEGTESWYSLGQFYK